MKLVFTITTKGHGKGGHFHSLNTIAEALGKDHEVIILNVGVQISESLEKKNYKVKFVRYNGYNFLTTYLRLKKIIKDFQPNAVHAFDVESFAFSRLLSITLNQPSYLTKCGGPNPKLYFPKPNNLVLFSLENQNYFNKNKSYKKVNKILIPNRVNPVLSDQNRITKLLKKHDLDNKIKVLRIARIGHHYYQSIIQGINLVEWLLKQGINAKLIIVGTVQNAEILSQIKKYIDDKKLSESVIIETSDEFTYKASGIINSGDVIIGTGRNFMEAASLNKLLLVPYQNDKYPLLVHDKNFKEVFETNFSPRTSVAQHDSQANLRAIKYKISQNCEANTILWFNENFDVNGAISKYTGLYAKDLNRKKFIFDTFLNILYSTKAFVLK